MNPTLRSAGPSAPRFLPWLCALAAFAPLVWCWRDFADLFWFGDDWDLINEMSLQPLWSWAWRPFGENFEPVFKLGWGAVIALFGGSHAAMIVVLWITHAAMVLLFTLLLRRAGAGWFSVLFCGTVFGLASANIETLGWATQWCSLLGTMFMGAAAWWFWRTDPLPAPWSWRVHGVLVALVTASAFSFPRGVVTGAGLAAVCLLPGLRADTPWSRRFAVAGLCLVGSVLSAGVTVLFAQGNQHQLAGHLPAMAEYGAWYFALSPLHKWFAVGTWGLTTTLLLGGLKAACIVYGLAVSRGRLRELFCFLVLIELAYAVLLGIGRYHTGLATTVSSRYQYPAFLSTLPFVAFALERILARLPGTLLRGPAAAACLVVALWFATHAWPAEADAWAGWRGRDGRAALLADPHPPATGAVPGVGMTTERAKVLIARYHLH